MSVRMSVHRSLALLLLCTPCAPLLAQPWQKIDLAKSEVGFVSKQMGVPVQGRFLRYDAQLSFDPQHPESGKVVLSVDLGSATFGVPETDAELRKPAWFDVSRFPRAQFVSNAVKPIGDGRFQVTGTLSIKGAQQPLVVPFQLTPAGQAAEASGTFTLKRLDFKIGEGEWADTSMVANDVQVRFKFTLVR